MHSDQVCPALYTTPMHLQAQHVIRLRLTANGIGCMHACIDALQESTAHIYSTFSPHNNHTHSTCDGVQSKVWPTLHGVMPHAAVLVG